MQAALEETGKTLECPDCGTMVLVPSPPDADGPPNAQVVADEYAMCDGVDQPPPDSRITYQPYVLISTLEVGN